MLGTTRPNIVLARRARVGEAGPAAAPTPADLLGPDGMWLSSTRGITTDVGVTSWVDQCANPVTFTQTMDASQPAVNSGPSRVTFDGNNDTMSTPSASKHQWTNKAYYGAWVRRLSAVAGDRPLWNQWDAGDVEQMIIRDRNDFDQFQVFIAINATSFANNNFPALPINTWVFVEVIYDGEQATATDRVRVWFTGVQQTRTGGSGTLPTTCNAANATTRLGSYQGTTNFLNFEVANSYTDKVLPDSSTRAALQAFEAPV